MLLVFKNEVNLRLKKSNFIFYMFEFIYRNINNLNFAHLNHNFSIISVDMIIYIGPSMFKSLDSIF